MARSVNKVTLIGNLGSAPDLRYTQNGTAVCNMSLATNESYTDQEGNEVQRTEWHDVVAWGRLEEICDEYLEKGSQVYFEGTLRTNEWEDQDGNTRQTTEVKALDMMFLDSNRQGQGDRSQQRSSGERQSRTASSSGFGQRTDGDGRPNGQKPGGGHPSEGSGGEQSGGDPSDDETFEPNENDDLPF